MPLNAPSEYYELEERYSKEKNVEEKERILKRMLIVLPKHKGTDREFASLKRRLSLLRKSAKKTAQKRKTFSIRKQWPRVLLVGYDTGRILSRFNLTSAGSLYYGVINAGGIQVQLVVINNPEKNKEIIEQSDAIISKYPLELPGKLVMVSDEPDVLKALDLCGAIAVFTGDSNDAVAMKKGDTVLTLAKKLHMSIGKNAYALIRGDNVKFQGQRVGMGYKLNNGDRVFIKV